MNRVFSLLFALGILAGCAKDKDEVFPSVELLSQLPAGTFGVGDTLRIHFRATDENLQKAVVKVVDADYNQVEPAINFNAVNGRVQAWVDIVLTNRYLETGTHYLQITAYDQSNQASGFAQFNARAIPKRLRSIWTAGIQGPDVRVYSLDSTYVNWSLKAQQFGDLAGLQANSFRQRIGFFPRSSGSWRWYNGQGAELQAGPVPGAAPYFAATALSGNQEDLLVALFNGYLEIWKASAGASGTRSLPEGWLPTALYANGEHVFLAVTNSGGSLHKLYVLHPVSFLIEREETLSFAANQVVPFGNELALFGNASGFAQWTVYNPTSYNVYTPATLPAAQFLGVASAGNRLWVALSDGVYQIQANTPGVVGFSSQVASCLACDPLNQEVILGSANGLQFYSLSGTLLRTSPSTFPINHIQLLYNK